jgi:hypothetical protein
MKLYQHENNEMSWKIIPLGIGSIILGLLIGTVAYLLSRIFYFMIIFPIGISFFSILAYSRFFEFFKLRNSFLGLFFGIVVGSLVVFTLHFIPYSMVKRDFIVDGAENYHVTNAIAEQAFNDILQEETGISGFLGYLILYGKSGEELTGSFFVGYAPISEFKLSLNSFWLWANWIVEALIIIIPTAIIGKNTAKNPFNRSVNQWYGGIPKQIGSVIFADKDKLLTALTEQDLAAVGRLIHTEDPAAHPQLELYENHSKNQAGDILVSIKQTGWNQKGRFKRRLLNQWEFSQKEFSGMLRILGNKAESSWES